MDGPITGLGHNQGWYSQHYSNYQYPIADKKTDLKMQYFGSDAVASVCIVMMKIWSFLNPNQAPKPYQTISTALSQHKQRQFNQKKH